MHIVTGGAGFIGSNLVKGLNDRGETDILVVDNLTNGHKMHNLADLSIADYMDRLDFIERLDRPDALPQVEGVFHLGATSATTEWNGQFVMKNNYDYSKRLLHWCLDRSVPFIYASSASVYGAGRVFKEDSRYERPINMYAFSKLQFDRYVRARRDPRTGVYGSPVAGLRYFNVYGPREQHKGPMASTAWHFSRQILESGEARLFGAHDGYGPGEQRRDFVHVDDCVKINLWCLDLGISGIFNVGTGTARSFNDMAQAVIDWHARHGKRGEITYIDFPDHLKAANQSFTEADLGLLRSLGYREPLKTLEAGVAGYLECTNGEAVANVANRDNSL